MREEHEPDQENEGEYELDQLTFLRCFERRLTAALDRSFARFDT